MLAHDPLSSLAYLMITHTPLVASNLPIKTLVARQRPTKIIITYKASKEPIGHEDIEETDSELLMHPDQNVYM